MTNKWRAGLAAGRQEVTVKPADKTTINKYLAAYGDDEAMDFSALGFRHYQHVLVIPAYREGLFFVENLRNFLRRSTKSALIIVIINEPHDAPDSAKKENRDLLSHLLEMGRLGVGNSSAQVISVGPHDIMAVGPLAINRHFGVGLARKIGCDASLRLISEGLVQIPIIYTTDADARLPADYFENAQSALEETQKCSGFIYPFFHESPIDQRLRLAIELYEKRLRLFVEGLSIAGSPYAYHTIGSTIAIHATAYAQVRGFPKIAAGEDFYLLNKLAKVGSVKQLSGSPIALSARVSDRVPFGTGPAISRILEAADPQSARIFYHPQIFWQLRSFLEQHMALIVGVSEVIPDYASVDHDLNQRAFLALKGGDGLARNLAERKTKSDRIKAFHDWFDAFRTLKFIHYLKDEAFPLCALHELHGIPTTQAQLKPL